MTGGARCEPWEEYNDPRESAGPIGCAETFAEGYSSYGDKVG
jgi:hypothetical protein